MLKSFIEEAAAAGSQKGAAILALDHLRNITAGDGDGPGDAICIVNPRAEGGSGSASSAICIVNPRAEGNPGF